jgi:type I restriction enzyme S subunit
MVLLRPDNALMDGRYLLFALQSPEVQHEILAHEGTGSTVSNLRIPALESLRIPAPPLDEQRRIATILGALDDKIELNRKMNRTLEELAQALFKSWFIDFDGHDDLVDSEIGPVPRGWEVGALGDVTELTMGQSPPGSTYNEHGGGLPFFQGATDFGSVFPTNRVYCNAPTRFAEEWDVLTSVRAPVGRTNVAISRCAIGRGVASIRSREGRYPTYVWCLIGSLSAALDVYNGEGTVFGSINKKALHVLPVVVPPIAKVAAFEEVSWPVLQHLRVTEEESRTLTDLRDTLLPKLISGELRAPEAEVLVEAAG